MPGFDGTGPHGEGPLTGGGMGYCVVPLNTPEQEIAYLENRAQVLKEQMRHIKVRIKELKELVEVKAKS